MRLYPLLISFMPLVTAGCAGLRFNREPQDDAFTYYEPSPFAAVKVAADCSTSVDIVSLPGRPRSISFKSGLGSAKLSVTTSNGIITQLGQETDTKIPETLTAIAGLAKTVGVGLAVGGQVDTKATCKPGVSLYAIFYNRTTKKLDLDPATSLAYQAMIDQRAADAPTTPTATPTPTPKM